MMPEEYFDEFAEQIIDYLEDNPRFIKLLQKHINKIIKTQDESEREQTEVHGFSYRYKNPVLLKTYLKDCADNDLKAIPPDDAVFAYFDEAKIPAEYRKIAWLHFREVMINRNKKQKDWRGTFRTYIYQRYMKLWYVNDDGDYGLTSLGKEKQARYKDKL